MRCKNFVAIVFIFSVAIVNAQSTNNSTSKNKSISDSYFKASFDYLSNRVYNGRADSILTPYLTPAISYYHKNGLNATAQASYDPNNGLLDLISLNAGYEFDILKDKLSASIDGDLYFYNPNSTSIKAGSVGDAEASIMYTNNIVSLTAGIRLDFYKTTKGTVYTTFALNHEFDFEGKQEGSNWSINPTLTTNFGNQKFLYTYRTQKQEVVLKKNKDTTETKTSVATTGNLKFQLLDYEFSLPAGYDSKHWGFLFTPTYAIPQNPITSTTTMLRINKKTGNQNTTTKTQTEALKNWFYSEIMVYIKF